MFHLNIELAAIKSHVHLSTAGLESPHSRQPMSNAVEPPRRQCRHWAQSLSEAWKSFHLFSSQVFLSFWASIESIVQPFPFSCCQEWESWRCCLLSDLEMELEWRECAFKIIYFECVLTLVGRGGTDGWIRTCASSFLMPGIQWIQAVGEEI